MRRPFAEVLHSVAGRAVRSRVPHAWTCDEVLRDPRKLRRLSAAALEELIGMEESSQKIAGTQSPSEVRARYPGGSEDVVQPVREACMEAAASERALHVALQRLEALLDGARWSGEVTDGG